MSNTIKVRDAIRRLSDGEEKSRLYRVVHIDKHADQLVVIEVRRKQRRKEKQRTRFSSMPPKRTRSNRRNGGGRNGGLQDWKLSDVKAWLKAPTAELVKWQPDPRMMRSEDELSLREKDLRKRDWDRIKSLVTGADAELLYDRTLRGSLIREHAQKTKIELNDLYPILRRYWEDGMDENSLLPDWVKTAKPACSRKAQTKPKNGELHGEAKSRRRSKSYRQTETDVLKFEEAHRMFFKKQGKNKIASYYLMLAKLYDAGTYDEQTCKFKLHDHLEIHDVPTWRQFQYFIHTKTDTVEATKERSRGTQFERNHRGLVGKSWQDIVGPTEEFQIDGTMTPINLVSSAKPKIILGKACVVAVSASWCPMVVGFVVSYRSPSIALARDALLNAFTDKVEFCARYDVEITEEDWPCHHVCQSLLPDRQELLTNEAEESLTRGTLHIAIHMPQAARPDRKSYIERFMGYFKTKLQAEGDPAAYPPDGLELGERHPMFKATETIDDLTRKLITIILHFNKNHVIEPARLKKEMLRDNVRPHPLDLWNWGLENAPTSPLSYTDDEIYYGLLPEGEATVAEDGIWFGLPNAKTKHCYNCERATKEQWFARARIDGSWRIKVLYDRLRARFIWLKRDDGTLERCTLMPWEEAAQNMRLDEITDVQDCHFEPTPEERRRRLEGEIGIARTNADVAQKAKTRRQAVGKGPSDREAKKMLAKNRAAEIEAEISERNERLDKMQGIETKRKAGKAEVIHLFETKDDFDLIAKIMQESQPQEE